MNHFDYAIIGAGMVGATVAYHLIQKTSSSIIWLEPTSQPGTQSSGRSAALYFPAYGGFAVRVLTRASRSFFMNPPTDFTEHPLLTPRGVLAVGGSEDRDSGVLFTQDAAEEGQVVQTLEGQDLIQKFPILRPETCAFGLYCEDAWDIDTHALLQGFVRHAKQNGAILRLNAGLETAHDDGERWHLTTQQGETLTAGTVINAAGAWVDEVAQQCGIQPIGIQPKRRSAFLFHPPEGSRHQDLPFFLGLDNTWYLKPDAGMLLGSPANQDLCPPHDVVPEELDIALGIDRIETMTHLTIRRPSSTWAGLRSFVTDGEPVLGFDTQHPRFFWAAGLGGYGIQTAPAVGAWCADVLQGGDGGLGTVLANAVNPNRLNPNRLARL